MQAHTMLALFFDNVGRAKIVRLTPPKIANDLVFQSAARMMIAFYCSIKLVELAEASARGHKQSIKT
jgi:hypothetical protein